MPSTAEIAAPSAAPPDAGSDGPAAPRWAVPAWWPWAAGTMLGLVVLGPALGGGSLLSLDLLVTPHIPVPNGMFGLGPALSQRVPLFAVLGVGSAVVGGPVATKALIVACVASGFAGAARLARVLAPPPVEVGIIGQAAAGLIWAGGPFALTRIGVGHINLVWVVAVLPWALPRLCRPADDPASTFLASLALAIGGPGGGTIGVSAAVIALVLQPPPRRWARPLAAIVAPQAIWVVPTAVLLWAGAGVNGANDFATKVVGAAGWPGIGAGSGFWRPDYQVGATGVLGACAGVAVVALTLVAGIRIVRQGGFGSWPAAAAVVAALGLLLALASAVPGVRVGYDWLSGLPFGAPLRESQRFSALWMVFAAAATPIGAHIVVGRLRVGDGRPARVAAAALVLVPLAVGLAVSVPGWWGVGGRLEPVEYPASWSVARTHIRDAPGTVVALPWAEYPPLSFAGGRQVFNPLPDYLGGDVISSYDPLFDRRQPRQEQVDRRSEVVDELVRQARRTGEPISPQLADLGVRWVVLAHERSWEDYGSLADDAGLDPVLTLPDLDLYQVRAWNGDAVAPDGTPSDVDRPIPPVLQTGAPKGSVLNVAGAPGWVQGWATPARVTPDGRLQLEGSGDTLWFWPSVLILAVDVAVVVAGFRCVASRRRRLGRILAPSATRG